MLSDEEKKAIDDLFALTHINGYIDLYTQREVKIHTLDLSKWQNGVKVLLNLIEKQSKEIKELKENNGYHLGFIDGGIAKRYEYEDKIKAKIEELEKGNKNTFIRGEKILVLQSLLEKE